MLTTCNHQNRGTHSAITLARYDCPQEPVAFWGGVFAGALGLSELDEPLRGWVERTAEQAGVSRR